VSWDPFHPDWIASATNIGIAQAMTTTQHLVNIQHKDEWRRAQTMEVLAEGKQVTMQFEGGETFMMKTEGQDTTTGYPSLREAIKRTFPTLVRLLQLTETDRIYGKECQEKGRKKRGWAQAIYPLRARLKQVKEANSQPGRQGFTPEDALINLRNEEQTFMAIRPKLIGAGYKTLDSKFNPSRTKSWQGTFLLPPIKRGRQKNPRNSNKMDPKTTQIPGSLSLHTLDIKEGQAQRDPGVEQQFNNWEG